MPARPFSAATMAAVLLLGALAGCDEDSVYDEGGLPQTSATPETSNPGLAGAGSPAPSPTGSAGPGISGAERSEGEGGD